jgi:molybdopterin molybdotransferase
VSTFDALGRMLAAPVTSALDVPPEDNTSMDGYALHAADVPVAGTELPVAQRIPAGVVGQPLARGTAARIFTGAQVPAGATAVVMQEQCEPDRRRRPGPRARQRRAQRRPVDTPPRRRRGARQRGAAPRHAADAAGAGHGGVGGRGHAHGACGARAWRCFPPATNW